MNSLEIGSIGSHGFSASPSNPSNGALVDSVDRMSHISSLAAPNMSGSVNTSLRAPSVPSVGKAAAENRSWLNEVGLVGHGGVPSGTGMPPRAPGLSESDPLSLPKPSSQGPVYMGKNAQGIAGRRRTTSGGSGSNVSSRSTASRGSVRSDRKSSRTNSVSTTTKQSNHRPRSDRFRVVPGEGSKTKTCSGNAHSGMSMGGSEGGISLHSAPDSAVPTSQAQSQKGSSVSVSGSDLSWTKLLGGNFLEPTVHRDGRPQSAVGGRFRVDRSNLPPDTAGSRNRNSSTRQHASAITKGSHSSSGRVHRHHVPNRETAAATPPRSRSAPTGRRLRSPDRSGLTPTRTAVPRSPARSIGTSHASHTSLIKIRGSPTRSTQFSYVQSSGYGQVSKTRTRKEKGAEGRPPKYPSQWADSNSR